MSVERFIQWAEAKARAAGERIKKARQEGDALDEAEALGAQAAYMLAAAKAREEARRGR